MTDKEEIIRALSLWFKPGDVFEVRVLGATSSANRLEHTASGYFDCDHITDAAEAIAKLFGYRGVYATANPVKRDLLARAVNRLRPIGRSEPTTSDADIERRRWLLIDCDADRPAGISSTDAEHEAALAKIREIRDGLVSMGWPQPIMTDSGNGAQLMVAIDLPAQDGGLVQRCLAAIAVVSDDRVHVDVTVCNPARIWRVPGTMNCKGDHAEGFRPHRMAHLVEVPEKLVTVTEAQLKDLAGDSAASAPGGAPAQLLWWHVKATAPLGCSMSTAERLLWSELNGHTGNTHLRPPCQGCGRSMSGQYRAIHSSRSKLALSVR